MLSIIFFTSPSTTYTTPPQCRLLHLQTLWSRWLLSSDQRAASLSSGTTCLLLTVSQVANLTFVLDRGVFCYQHHRDIPPSFVTQSSPTGIFLSITSLLHQQSITVRTAGSEFHYCLHQKTSVGCKGTDCLAVMYVDILVARMQL